MIFGDFINTLLEIASAILAVIVGGSIMALGVRIAIWFTRKTAYEGSEYWKHILIIAGVTLAVMIIAVNIVFAVFNGMKIA